MPILGDHLQEIDRSYTRVEKGRREKMRLRNKQYGFFRVSTEAAAPLICERCHLEINGQSLKINGVLTHYEPCV